MNWIGIDLGRRNHLTPDWDKGFYRPPPRFLQKGGVTFNRPDAERFPAAGCKSEVTCVKEEKDIKGQERQLTAAAIGILF